MIWKLSFLGHFVPLKVPITETRLNVSKPQDVKATDLLLCGPVQTNDHPTIDLGKLLYQKFIILPHCFERTIFTNLAAVKLHTKGNWFHCFFEIGSGTESAFENESEENIEVL